MSLLPVDSALIAILTGVEPVGDEAVPLVEASGRVLANDLAARRTQPPFPASAMDGYAVRAADVASLPARLAVIGEAIAGRRFDGSIGSGEAVRIFTGAPVPDGADAIVIQENTVPGDGGVTVVDGVAEPGAYVRPAGLDFSKGETLLPAGTILSSRHIALAAAMNHASLPVRRRPRLAVLATGSELVPPGKEPGPDQIVSSNAYGIAALVEAVGGEALDFGIATDDDDVLDGRFSSMLEAEPDIIVTLGGASVGDHDLVQGALTRAGFSLDFWKIAMRPGKPFMFGRREAIRLMGLPGNPVSAMVCGRIFLVPLIRALLGIENPDGAQTARLRGPVPANGERQDFMRATLHSDGTVEAFTIQDSSMLATLASANAFIVRPIGAPAAVQGDIVPVLRFDF